MLSVITEKIQDFWVCAGFENNGTLRFLSLSRHSLEAASKAASQWTRGNKPQLVNQTPETIRNALASVEDTLAGHPIFRKTRFALPELPRFQRKVLQATTRIPRGKVATYASIAAAVGSPGAARAVGNAEANNPLPFLVPCHRVVKSDLTLGGYAFGLSLKRRILELEGVGFSSTGKKAKVKRCFLFDVSS